MNFRVWLYFFLLLVCDQLRAQTEAEPFVESVIESLSERSDNSFDYSELSERLNYYRKHPINVNKAKEDQLKELGFLSPAQIRALLHYRKENGKLIDLPELQAIELFSLPDIQKLLPFITINDSDLPAFRFKDLKRGDNDLMFTYNRVLQNQSGYAQSDSGRASYSGAAYHLLTRYRFHYTNRIAASLTTEKDAGEPLFSRSRGFDFYSGNVSYEGEKLIKRVVLGDYSLQFGQGLSMWSGMAFGKGSLINSVVKSGLGLKPYTSANESSFLRGAAAVVNFNKVEITPFFSYRALDATLTDLPGDSGIVSSIRQSGLHRTSAELNAKNNLNQQVGGADIQFSTSSLTVGTTIYSTRFDREFKSDDDFSSGFSGAHQTNFSAYYTFGWRNFYFFGEVAHSSNRGSAFLNGSLISLTPQFSLVLLHRNYQKKYGSFFQQPLSEGSEASNEKGFYSGVTLTPNRTFEFSAYADLFKFPAPRFNADAPSSGYELFSQVVCTPGKKFRGVFRYRYKNKAENDDQENAINYLEELKKHDLRFEFSYRISQAVQLRSRAEAVLCRKGSGKPETGFLLFQDAIYTPPRSAFSGNFRYAVFNVSAFDARIYAYENDVLYGFSAPAFQNAGLRFYANGRLRVNRQVDVWARYAVTSYARLNEIGSALDKIEGHIKSDFKLQLRMQF